jgi:hypothetical protein
MITVKERNTSSPADMSARILIHNLVAREWNYLRFTTPLLRTVQL